MRKRSAGATAECQRAPKHAQCSVRLRAARENTQERRACLAKEFVQLTDESREERPQRDVAKEEEPHGGPLVEDGVRALHVANELRPQVETDGPVRARARREKLQRVARRRVVPRVRAPREHRDAGERARRRARCGQRPRPARRHPLEQKITDVPPRLCGNQRPRIVEAKGDGTEAK